MCDGHRHRTPYADGDGDGEGDGDAMLVLMLTCSSSFSRAPAQARRWWGNWVRRYWCHAETRSGESRRMQGGSLHECWPPHRGIQTELCRYAGGCGQAGVGVDVDVGVCVCLYRCLFRRLVRRKKCRPGAIPTSRLLANHAAATPFAYESTWTPLNKQRNTRAAITGQ